MASRVVMPKLTDTMEEGVVVKWKKREGEVVGSGDVLAEIETDKAVMDLEAFASGTLRRVLVNEGTTVAHGECTAGHRRRHRRLELHQWRRCRILPWCQPGAKRPERPLIHQAGTLRGRLG